MKSEGIKLRCIEAFIRETLPQQLERDLRVLRMVKEADLEACAYYHLRRLLRRDLNWNVYIRKHSKHTGHYIDILLFKRGYPRIAIELKWNRAMSSKDRRSLRRALKRLRVNKAYFIATRIGATHYERINKSRNEKNRLFVIDIPLHLNGKALRAWKDKRRSFMSRMVKGRAKSKHAA